MHHAGENIVMTKGGYAADVCGWKFISHPCKFIYFEVAKTGTGSLLNLLTEHTSITRMDERLGFLEYSEYLRFAFVRNPWDRILSCYLSKIKKDKSFENENFENGVMRKFQRFNVFYAGMPFDEFLRAVAKIPDETADGHFSSQYTRLVLNGEVIITHLARFENYRDEVRKFLDMIGLDSKTKLPHINKSRNRKAYPEYYNDETIRIVEQRYKEDIRIFGYRFD